MSGKKPSKLVDFCRTLRLPANLNLTKIFFVGDMFGSSFKKGADTCYVIFAECFGTSLCVSVGPAAYKSVW
jgi:hypothetical protein